MHRTPRAVIVLVGDELLAGEVFDRNGPSAAVLLRDAGFEVVRIEIVRDTVDDIVEAVGRARAGAELLCVFGGLGPTSDDQTTESIARAMSVDIVMVEEQWQRIRQMFQALRGAEPPPGNEKQACIPAGSEPLANPHGTAPGYYLPPVRGAAVAVFPGPPRENQPMLTEQLLPRLDRDFPGRNRLQTHVLRVFGLSESAVGHKLRQVEASYPDLRIGYQFKFPEVLVKLRADARAEARVREAAAKVRAVLEPHVYGEGDDELPCVVGRSLAAQKRKVVTAESCTGGLVSKLLTDTPGSSAWFERGFVTYTNAAKREILRVPADVLMDFGAVSEQTAMAMLEGALERSAADLGLAITGISGPDGGTPAKPVGTVCIAWGDRRHRDVRTWTFRWDRQQNRLISAWTAIHRLYLHHLEA